MSDTTQNPPVPASPAVPTAPAPPQDIAAAFTQQNVAAQVAPPRTTAYHANVERADISDESIKTGDFDIYKGTTKRVDRISMLTPRDIAFGRVHYIEHAELGGYTVCESKWGRQGKNEVLLQQAICCERAGMPKKRFAALVIHYTTDPTGKLISPFSFGLKVWRFNETTYEMLRNTGREYPLDQHDMLVACTDEQYQKVTLSSCKEAICRTELFGKQFGEEVAAFISMTSPRLDRAVARKLDLADWAKALGAPAVAGFGGVTGGADTRDVPDIAALLGGAPLPR